MKTLRPLQAPGSEMIETPAWCTSSVPCAFFFRGGVFSSPLIFGPGLSSRGRNPAFTVSRVRLSTTWSPEMLRVVSTWKNSRLCLSSLLPSHHRQVLLAYPMLLSGFSSVQKLMGTNYPLTPDFTSHSLAGSQGQIPQSKSRARSSLMPFEPSLWALFHQQTADMSSPGVLLM